MAGSARITPRRIALSYLVVIATMASSYLLRDQPAMAALTPLAWLVGILLIVGFTGASAEACRRGNEGQRKMSKRSWYLLSFDLALLPILMPTLCSLPGIAYGIGVAAIVRLITGEEVLIFVTICQMLGGVFVVPYTPYVWPIFIGRARRSSEVPHPLALPPTVVLICSAFGSLLFVFFRVSATAKACCIGACVSLWIIYLAAYRRFPRFRFPAIPS